MSRIRADKIVNGAGTGAPSFPKGIILSGVSTITADITSADISAENATFSGIITSASLSVSGNVSVGGTLTYEDVTSIDSVGIITAQAGIRVTGGRVGIGTDNPTEDLHVYKSGGSPIIKVETTSPTGGTTLQLKGGSGRVDFGVTGGSSNRGRILYANAANTLNGAAGDRMEFFTNNDLSNSAILITSDNKIGIGSAIPQQTLEVNSGATANGVSLNTTYAGGPNIAFKVNGTIKSYIGSGGGFSQNGDGDDLALRATDNILFGIAGSEKVRIDSEGVVHTKTQPFIYGVPTNTGGSGIFNSLGATQSRGGMTFTTDRITVSKEGVYLITFNTICDTTTGRIDAFILVNGSNIVNTLNEANGNGYHYRGASICRYLYENDYIQVNNADWYSAASNTTTWKTMSVAFLG